MSRWTHITGVINIDHFPFFKLDQAEVETFISIIEQGAPIGSEGGLVFFGKKVQELRGNGAGMNWGAVGFIGDLRDFDTEDVKQAEEWFVKLTAGLYDYKGTMIRNGVIEVEVESEKTPRVYLFSSETKEWEELGDPDNV
jgi:hypothetical protein